MRKEILFLMFVINIIDNMILYSFNLLGIICNFDYFFCFVDVNIFINFKVLLRNKEYCSS